MNGWDDATADWYAGKYGDDPVVFTVVKAAKVPQGAAVVDIGCGTGSALRALAGISGELTGVDPTPRMIDHAKQHTPEVGIAYLMAPAEALPLADASQDVALAINSIHHWSDEAQGLREAFRVLKPAGRLVIGGERFGAAMVPGGQDYTERLQKAGFTSITHRDIMGGFVTEASKPEGDQDVP